MAHIDKDELEHLAELARIELSPEEEQGLLNDFTGILNRFQELESLDVSHVTGMTGGTNMENVFRIEDEIVPLDNSARSAFPEEQNGYAKVPKVFEGR